MSIKSYKENLEEYWDSDYYSTSTKFSLNNYIFEVENAIVYLIGDLEGDYTMIFNWLIDKKIIDTDLNWIAPENVYIIQTGDQLDKYSETFVNEKGKFQLPRRQRTYSQHRFGSDFEVVLLFDYLCYISSMTYGSERVIPLLGNHEVMNLRQMFKYAYDHSTNNKYAELQIKILLNLMTNDGSPINNILNKRPVITKFNNLIVSHAGLNLESIKWYTRFTNKDFDIDEFIDEVNKLSPETYLQENLYYKKVIEPLIWNRDYQNKDTPLTEDYEELGSNVLVIGHNPFRNVVVCDEEKCNDLKTRENIEGIKMIKVDTGLSSRFCKNNLSEIYTAKIVYENFDLKDIKEEFFGFKCESTDYPKISFINNKKVLEYTKV